jgi:uncharacterized protein
MYNLKQSVERPFGITVYGSFLLRTEPDHAVAELGVSRLAQRPADAFKEARDVVQATRTALHKAEVADEKVEVSRIALESAYERFGGATKFLGYRAQVSVRIVIDKIDGLERVLVAAVDAGANEVRSVRYRTGRLRELREEARSKAVAAARRKAEVYCAAAGVRVGQVIHIEDVSPDQLATRVGGMGHGAMGSASGQDEAAEQAGLQSGSLEVGAAVMVSYSLLHD